MPLESLLEKIESERRKPRFDCENWDITYREPGFRELETQWSSAFDECFPESSLPVLGPVAPLDPSPEPELTDHQKKVLMFKAMREEDIRNGMRLNSFEEINAEVERLRANPGHGG